MEKKNKHNPVLPHSDPTDLGNPEQSMPSEGHEEDQSEKYGKGPEPTIEGGEGRTLTERPEAQDQKI